MLPNDWSGDAGICVILQLLDVCIPNTRRVRVTNDLLSEREGNHIMSPNLLTTYLHIASNIPTYASVDLLAVPLIDQDDLQFSTFH